MPREGQSNEKVPWNARLKKVQEFIQTNGHSMVPSRHPDIGCWVTDQRHLRRSGKLSQERIDALDKIGFIWDDREWRWNSRLDELKEFIRVHGHCRIPRPGHKLGQWVSLQRSLHKNGKLREDRIQKLNDLVGFVWNPYEPSSSSSNSQVLSATTSTSTHKMKSAVSASKHQAFEKSTKYNMDVDNESESEDKSECMGDGREEDPGETAGRDDNPKKSPVKPHHDKAWNAHLQMLQEFIQMNGHSIVPRKHPESWWVNDQRQFKKLGQLSQDRIAALNEIGFEWNPLEWKWNSGFTKLKEFQRIHGHCNVPIGLPGQIYANGFSLSAWVLRQRLSHNRGKLRADRIQKLEGLGFDWTRRISYTNLPKYTDDTDVESELEDEGECVEGEEEEEARKTTDNDDNRRELPIPPSHYEKTWNACFQIFHEFVRTNGHSVVPTNHPQIGQWMSHQRKKKKCNTLSQHHVDALNKLGFVWDKYEEEWKSRCAALKEFQEVHGHCNPHCCLDASLWNWVERQRQCRRQGMLREDQIQQLEDINFDWSAPQGLRPLNRGSKQQASENATNHTDDYDVESESEGESECVEDEKEEEPRETPCKDGNRKRKPGVGLHGEKWTANLKKVQEFIQMNGHSLVPRHHPAGYWVSYQRYLKNCGKLSQDRIDALNEIGFIWDDLAWKWSSKFAELKEFQRIYGHCRVLQRHHGRRCKLGEWVHKQRCLKRKGKLPEDRIQRLNDLPGFIWNFFESSSSNNQARSTRTPTSTHKATVSKHRASKKSTSLKDDNDVEPESEGKSVCLEGGKEEEPGKTTGMADNRKMRRGVLPIQEKKWNANLRKVQEFIQTHGHSQIPVKGSQIGRWAGVQRNKKMRNELSQDRVDALNEIGFVWDAHDLAWNSRFAELKEFRKVHGHCNAQRQRDGGLGMWVERQRRWRRQGKLREERIQKLEDLGFEFNRPTSGGLQLLTRASKQPALKQSKKYADDHVVDLVSEDESVEEGGHGKTTGLREADDGTSLGETDDCTGLGEAADGAGLGEDDDGTGLGEDDDDTGLGENDDGTGLTESEDDTGLGENDDGIELGENDDDGSGVADVNDNDDMDATMRDLQEQWAAATKKLTAMERKLAAAAQSLSCPTRKAEDQKNAEKRGASDTAVSFTAGLLSLTSGDDSEEDEPAAKRRKTSTVNEQELHQALRVLTQQVQEFKHELSNGEGMLHDTDDPEEIKLTINMLNSWTNEVLGWIRQAVHC